MYRINIPFYKSAVITEFDVVSTKFDIIVPHLQSRTCWFTEMSYLDIENININSKISYGWIRTKLCSMIQCTLGTLLSANEHLSIYCYEHGNVLCIGSLKGG